VLLVAERVRLDLNSELRRPSAQREVELAEELLTLGSAWPVQGLSVLFDEALVVGVFEATDAADQVACGKYSAHDQRHVTQ